MPDPFKPTDWLSKIPGWLKAVFGLIGTIAAFTIALRENLHLYATVTIILILAYVLGASLYILLARRPSRSKKVKWVYRFEKQRRWGFAGLAATLLISAILLSISSVRTAFMYGILGTPTATPLPQQASPDVLIADFDARNAKNKMDVAHRLENDLKATLKKSGLDNIRVAVLSQPIADTTGAQRAANETGSRVVIWGWYDDKGIQVKVFLSGRGRPGSELPGTLELPLAVSGKPETEISFVVKNVLPENVSFLSLFVIGHLEYLSGHYEEGHKAFDAAMNNIPANVSIENEAVLHFFQARQMDSLGGNVNDVICEYSKAIRSDPGFAEAYNNLGVVMSRFVKIDLPNNAVELIDQPSPAAYQCSQAAGIEKETFESPQALYEIALKKDPNLTVAQFNQVVFEWRVFPPPHGESPNPYIESFEEIRKKDPSIGSTYLILGSILDSERNRSAAIQMYEQGIKADPSNSLLHFNLGQLYLTEKKDETRAEQEFQAALTNNPKDMEVRLALGSLYYGQGKFEKASAQLNEILKSEQSNPVVDSVHEDSAGPDSVGFAARILQSGILFQKDDHTQAIEIIKNIVQNDSQKPFAYFLLGMLYRSTGQNEQAADSLGKILVSEDLFAEENQTSQKAWIRILSKCFSSAGDFTEKSVSQELPESTCLAANDKDRVVAIYDFFYQAIPERRMVPESFALQAECPYVYSYDPATRDWKFQTTILYKLVNHEAAQMRPLKEFHGKLLIREEEPEISHLNRLYVLAEMLDGSFQILVSNTPELKKTDTDSVILHQGEQFLISFDDSVLAGDVKQWWVMAVGYYTPIYPPRIHDQNK